MAGFMHWLGRQVGYVKKAVKTDVAERPEEKLRRTIVDEVVREKKK
jgi:hypothetical protein